MVSGGESSRGDVVSGSRGRVRCGRGVRDVVFGEILGETQQQPSDKLPQKNSLSLNAPNEPSKHSVSRETCHTLIQEIAAVLHFNRSRTIKCCATSIALDLLVPVSSRIKGQGSSAYRNQQDPVEPGAGSRIAKLPGCVY
ncbi:hypothetical protein KCU99_g354, partial [Aureobasidium melanogenum]